MFDTALVVSFALCKLGVRCCLQDENEEMGRELSEDRFHKLERQLALAKGFAEDMQAAFQECEDHATALDEEAEKIQEEVGLDMDLLQWF